MRSANSACAPAISSGGWPGMVVRRRYFAGPAARSIRSSASRRPPNSTASTGAETRSTRHVDQIVAALDGDARGHVRSVRQRQPERRRRRGCLARIDQVAGEPLARDGGAVTRRQSTVVPDASRRSLSVRSPRSRRSRSTRSGNSASGIGADGFARRRRRREECERYRRALAVENADVAEIGGTTPSYTEGGTFNPEERAAARRRQRQPPGEIRRLHLRLRGERGNPRRVIIDRHPG